MFNKSTQMKRGALASPRHELAAAKSHEMNILEEIPVNHIWLPETLSTWLNDKYGDCVTAEEAFAKACHNPEIFISDNEVYNWAAAHNVLNGAYISDVLKIMQKDGFSQDGNTYTDGNFYSVNWTDPKLLSSALYQGPVKIGVSANQLESVCKEYGFSNGWIATGFSEDYNVDHCISICGYGTFSWLAEKLNTTLPYNIDGSIYGYALFTWGSIGIIDRESLLAITTEAWLRNPTTLINNK
ncbi:hypothetical protein PMI54_005373 [Salmonella enterica]|nr:hypothetical protein [Salmonella enterica]